MDSGLPRKCAVAYETYDDGRYPRRVLHVLAHLLRPEIAVCLAYGPSWRRRTSEAVRRPSVDFHVVALWALHHTTPQIDAVVATLAFVAHRSAGEPLGVYTGVMEEVSEAEREIEDLDSLDHLFCYELPTLPSGKVVRYLDLAKWPLLAVCWPGTVGDSPVLPRW